MEFYDKEYLVAERYFGSDASKGLSTAGVSQNLKKFGSNSLTAKKEKGFFKGVLDLLREPMLLILLISFVISLGTDVGQALKTGKGDFSECIGILFAILLSVSITMIMEGSSKKAFLALNSIYDNLTVKVVREGEIIVINQKMVVAGDILLLESGDKIVADGRLIESNSLEIDESALTGESESAFKEASLVLPTKTPLAERVNSVFSGSFVRNGRGKMIVTSVGDQTEMGSIAKAISGKKEENSPLSQKLAKLGKRITLIGVLVSVVVFILSLIKLITTNSVSFSSVQELFISSVVLIVAAVPEGLPTIVAISLALNMIKLAKENALIKKMIATETAGAVSVICTDKTGTLTKNDMQVVDICESNFCYKPSWKISENLVENFICNTIVEEIVVNGKSSLSGSATERAIVSTVLKSLRGVSLNDYRKEKNTEIILPFSSSEKIMISRISKGEKYRYLLKGAPEKVLEKCGFTNEQKDKIIKGILEYQKKARRVLCFAHLDGGEYTECEYVFDGYVCIADPVREEVKKSVSECLRAGIKVKILTGDNKETALAVAIETGIATSGEGVFDAKDLEKMDDKTLIKALDKIKVIARSTPSIKLRIVKALKQKGEVVAVTGDGINDAPAIKHADVGIAMGKTGSEITKESADVILLDDSFLTVVKAISFGRNVYRNLQRFIIFQLSVNLSALLFIATCAILGLSAPFNTLQLLWINVIMDGPPALTLGLEKGDGELMRIPPIKKEASIVSYKMLLKIIFTGVFISFVMTCQYLYDFLSVGRDNQRSVIFTLFILFQLFNAFNARELGIESIFRSITKNKIMAITFLGVFLIHLFIVEVCGNLFSIKSMEFEIWIKCIITSFSIVAICEVVKSVLRGLRGQRIERERINKKFS